MRGSELSSSARPASEPIAYTLQEVAQMLALSYRKVRYMVDEGEIEVVHFGRARRVLRTALQRYITDLEQGQRRAS